MSTYRHIVIPVDLTEESIRTLQQGMVLAREHGAMLHVVYVITADAWWEQHDEHLTRRLAEAQQALLEISRSLGSLEHEVVMRIGNFEEQLRQYCNRVRPDLIMMPATLRKEADEYTGSQLRIVHA